MWKHFSPLLIFSAIATINNRHTDLVHPIPIAIQLVSGWSAEWIEWSRRRRLQLFACLISF